MNTRGFAAILAVFVSVWHVGAVEVHPPQDIPGCATMPPRVIDGPLPIPARSPFAEARLGVWVKEDGRVEEVEFINGTEEWREAVLGAARNWRFVPVECEGQGIPFRTEIVFSQAGTKYITSSVSSLPNFPGEIHSEEEWGLEKPLILGEPEAVLPLIVRSSRMSRAEVALKYIVTENGFTDNVELLGATSEGAVRLALDLISERKYAPGKVRGQPVGVQYQQVLSFQNSVGSIEALAGATEIADPCYPYERFLAQEEGYAVIRFTLDAEGRVASAKVQEASHPDFGASLQAAVEGWVFTPESIQMAGAEREYRHDFALSQTAHAARRLMADVRLGNVVSNSSAGLSAKPKMLVRPAIVYPTALLEERTAGIAEVEFVVDRAGLTQIPRVLKASRPEFGWAAVTLVSGMRFVPLKRDGKPAEIRVRFPVQFVPPAEKKTETPAAG